ncbi:hypothetical protein F2Q68_00045293 [Brassica cretica]|uniref:Uncharacterized protein n=1 Tax=Brassica cretica TaxID=69181 RepID=A0A8S9LQD0_BRACR|nr:hypothetical protein F2Q68_00045293 [Brassica cretica]
MGASLPPKEANLFKLIVKSYETKQYKKGLKAADAILKKFPSHGETLSMKGLTLNCMNRKTEAYELVRLGVKNDIKSHVCWHVFGLLYRSDREYREAIKCYRNALRIDPENLEILRDLSLLQAQMRDLSGFVETRQQLLTLKPNHRMNWIGFAVSQHLNSNASKAVEILEAFEGTLEDDYPPENELCEHTEMILYKVSLLEEIGAFDKALEELHKKEPKIVDKLSYKELEVSLLSKLGRPAEADKLYRVLLSMNPDNYRYYEGLQKCFGLYSESGQYSSDKIEKLNALYQSLSEQYTRSSAVKRIPLDFLQDESFKEAVAKYIKPLLTKGVPSLFSDLSSLYDHPRKPDILEQVVVEMEHSIRTTGSYPGREYREAIKCYRNALRIDPENLEILRDLSLLQAQMRDLSGFVETRQQLLTLKPNHRMNWIGFAVSQHLNANASKAVEILEAFEGTLEDDYPPENELCEHTEMILYKVSLLEEIGAFDKALDELRKKEPKIVDKLSYKELEVSLLSKLGRPAEADKLYRVLLSMNPDNYRYYEGLQKCFGLYSESGQYSFDKIEKLNALYQSLSEQYTRSSAVKRIPLDFLQDESFKEAVAKYIKPLLTKGVPSLFSDLSSLYDHPRKPDILEQVVVEMEHSIRTTGSYPGSDVKEPPSTLLWTLFFLAQHYDKRGQYDVALGWKSRCAEYFPCSTYFEGKRSSVMPDSVYNSSRKSNENGDTPNHPMGQTELGDGQVEAFKSISVST